MTYKEKLDKGHASFIFKKDSSHGNNSSVAPSFRMGDIELFCGREVQPQQPAIFPNHLKEPFLTVRLA